MKKSAYLILFLCLFSSPTIAIAENGSTGETYNVENQPYTSEQSTTDENDDDAQESDDFYNELISPDYGSDQSPAFNNRGDMNPNESNYGYEGAY